MNKSVLGRRRGLKIFVIDAGMLEINVRQGYSRPRRGAVLLLLLVGLLELIHASSAVRCATSAATLDNLKSLKT